MLTFNNTNMTANHINIKRFFIGYPISNKFNSLNCNTELNMQARIRHRIRLLALNSPTLTSSCINKPECNVSVSFIRYTKN